MNRQQEAAADVELRKLLWVGLGNAVPVKDPVAALERLAGALESMAENVGGKVNELTHVAGGRDLTQLRGEVVLLERVLSMLQAALTNMARLGLAERAERLDRAKAMEVAAAVRVALAAVPDLSWSQHRAFIGAFMKALGLDPGSDGVVVGEVEG